MLKEGKPQMGISSVIDILEPCMEDKGLLQQGKLWEMYLHIMSTRALITQR